MGNAGEVNSAFRPIGRIGGNAASIMSSIFFKRGNDVPANRAKSMESAKGGHAGGAKICMPVFSAFAQQLFRAGLREAQDVLSDCCDVDVIALEPTGVLPRKEKWMARLLYHDWSRKVVTFNPGLRPVRIEKDYDLFVLVCPWWRDVWYANAIEGWRDRCRTSVCWIDELWLADLPHLHYWFPILSKFDYVFTGINGTAKALAEIIGRPCHELVGGVDAFRFSPFPDPPARAIDVLSVGRRNKGIHEAVLKLAAAEELFYVHDTVQTGDSCARDYREHRDMYARMAKRSRFFMVAPGKFDVHGETNGQIDVGFRYFEGAASGAVLLGQSANCDLFRSHFGWRDAVVEAQPDGSDVAEIILELRARPERTEEIGRINAAESLRRHDWIYRWKDIFRIAGVPSPAGMDLRIRRLSDLAGKALGGRVSPSGVS